MSSEPVNQPPTDKEDKDEPGQEISEDWNTFDESIFTKAINQQLSILDKTVEASIKKPTNDTKPKQVKQSTSTSTPSKLNSNPAAQSNKAKYKLSHQSRKCKFDGITQSPARNLDNSASRIEVLQQQNDRKSGPRIDMGHLKQPNIVPPILDPSSLPQFHTEDKALASMLMAWYMAGYHTGHYDAMKRKQTN